MHRQLFAHFGIVRMRFQMFDMRRRELARLDFLRLQKCRRVQQADVFHAFRQSHRLPVVLRENDFFRLAEMRHPLFRLQGRFGVGKTRDDFLQRRPRRIHVGGKFDVPVGELGERGGHQLHRRFRPFAKMVQRVFRAGQIGQVFRLDARQQHHAFKIVREFRELLADFHDGFVRLAPVSLGLGDGIKRLFFRRLRCRRQTNLSADWK